MTSRTLKDLLHLCPPLLSLSPFTYRLIASLALCTCCFPCVEFRFPRYQHNSLLSFPSWLCSVSPYHFLPFYKNNNTFSSPSALFACVPYYFLHVAYQPTPELLWSIGFSVPHLAWWECKHHEYTVCLFHPWPQCLELSLGTKFLQSKCVLSIKLVTLTWLVFPFPKPLQLLQVR